VLLDLIGGAPQKALAFRIKYCRKSSGAGGSISGAA
jgi:hypothetical protein